MNTYTIRQNNIFVEVLDGNVVIGGASNALALSRMIELYGISNSNVTIGDLDDKRLTMWEEALMK